MSAAAASNGNQISKNFSQDKTTVLPIVKKAHQYDIKISS
jgi:hypothetical protein